MQNSQEHPPYKASDSLQIIQELTGTSSLQSLLLIRPELNQAELKRPPQQRHVRSQPAASSEVMPPPCIRWVSTQAAHNWGNCGIVC